MLTRRHFLQGLGGLALGSAAFGSYALAIEPTLMLDVRATPSPPRPGSPTSA